MAAEDITRRSAPLTTARLARSEGRMDSSPLLSTVIAVSVAIGLGIAMARQGKKNATIAALIEPKLREHGAMTLPALAQAL